MQPDASVLLLKPSTPSLAIISTLWLNPFMIQHPPPHSKPIMLKMIPTYMNIIPKQIPFIEMHINPTGMGGGKLLVRERGGYLSYLNISQGFSLYPTPPPYLCSMIQKFVLLSNIFHFVYKV